MPGPRITPQTASVLGALLEREHVWGFEIGRATGLKAGTIYPILARLVAAGWVEDAWEDPELGRAEGRPPRRYYRLTTTGRARAVHATAPGAPTPGAVRDALPGTSS